jgi:phosphate transport system permease protein
MSTTVLEAQGESRTQGLRIHTKRDQWRKIKNIFMQSLLVVAAIAAVFPLMSVFTYVLERGISGLSWDFFTHLQANVGETGGGMANALLGSLILIVLASLVGVPWGIAAGIYLSEYGDRKLSRSLRFVVDLLTSVPSIVVGIFVYALLVIPMKGFSSLAGGAALAILMVPSVARTTEEMLKLVPSHIREAGLALGVSRWKVILRIVLRGSRSGVITGVMLAVARVSGETAPLLFTAFNNRFWARGLNQPTASLPVQIYTYAISPYEEWHKQAWAGALVLVSLVFTLNLLTRLLAAGKSQGNAT